MRDSDDKVVNFMFTNPLSNTGRLQISRNNHGSDEIQFSQSKLICSLAVFMYSCSNEFLGSKFSNPKISKIPTDVTPP